MNEGDGKNLVLGALVVWSEQYGVIELVEGPRVTVRFDSGEKMAFVASSGQLRRWVATPGTQVTRLADNSAGVVLESVPSAAYPTWKVGLPGATVNVAEMGLRPAAVGDPVERIRSRMLGSARDFNLRAVAADYWASNKSDVLVSLSHARVDLKPHQVSVVHRVVSTYPHRFLLCDEVGLGKTIEAAMIVKELRARGHARRVLILVPSGLVRQWQFELKTKFNESFSIFDSSTLKYLKGKGTANPWGDSDSVIASHSWAAFSPERVKEISEVQWDMIIVDEAHHARAQLQGNTEKRTKLFKLVHELVARPEFSRRAALFLTATPLQLERHELYSLVEMLDPVLFASEIDFERHLASLAGLNRCVEELQRLANLSEVQRTLTLRDAGRLLDVDPMVFGAMLSSEGPLAIAKSLRERHRLSEVLIRNRKAVVQGFQPRKAHRWEVELTPEEQRVHDLVGSVVRDGLLRAAETKQNALGFVMIMLQRLLASSSQALALSLEARRGAVGGKTDDEDEAEESLAADSDASTVVARLASPFPTEAHRLDEVLKLVGSIKMDSKARVLIGELDSLFATEPRARVLIFTEFRETQRMLNEKLSHLAAVNLFHGQLAPEQKDAAVERFRHENGPSILISTEAGGEGRNFQFCHYVINYDLPWNPMKVEQRIGRVDRIGQEHPITIFNFNVHGTIEGRILDVLERRIRIFEEAVGGLDPILGATESTFRDALKLADGERAEALERIGRQVEQQVAAAREADSQLRDFILQDKSYSAEVARTLLQVQSPISQDEFEVFLLQLLASVNTYIGPKQPNGERRIIFYPPFVLEHPELINGQDSRRVCFDPRLNVDTERVEYLGFGHPIVDSLVRRVTEERPEGMTAARRTDAPANGWQFNWYVTVGGLRPKDFVLPLFVGADGTADAEEGKRLLLTSRKFAAEEDEAAGMSNIDTAFQVATSLVVQRRDSELAEAQHLADERADIEETRTRLLMEHRKFAANDKSDSCRKTLERLRDAESSATRQAIPLWEANLKRAEGELAAIESDLVDALRDLAARRRPSADFRLLNVAWIHGVFGDESLGVAQ